MSSNNYSNPSKTTIDGEVPLQQPVGADITADMAVVEVAVPATKAMEAMVEGVEGMQAEEAMWGLQRSWWRI